MPDMQEDSEDEDLEDEEEEEDEEEDEDEEELVSHRLMFCPRLPRLQNFSRRPSRQRVCSVHLTWYTRDLAGCKEVCNALHHVYCQLKINNSKCPPTLFTTLGRPLRD